MAQPYVGEIRMFAGNFAPAGWSFCSGQLMPISENETLFQLIGTTYGGDGQETFALPNLQSRIPLHQGSSGGNTLILAETGGVEDVTLTSNQMPSHNHALTTTDVAGTSSVPGPTMILADHGPAGNTNVPIYVTAGTATQVPLAATSIAATGGSQPHTNVQPFLCVNFIISMFGIFPSPT